MRGIAILMITATCWLLPACSGGTKGPASATSPSDPTNPAAQESSESDSPSTEEGSEPQSPEIVMEVIKTVLD